MCATFFYHDKEITSVGQFEDTFQVPIRAVLNSNRPADWEPDRECCLCYVDPLVAAIKLDKLVLCDPTLDFYTFQDRDSKALT